MGQFGGAWAGRVIQGPALSGAPWMSGIEQLAEMITTDLEQRLPGQRKTQRDKLALLVATMLQVRSANLMDVAACLPRPAERLDSRCQWIKRFLARLSAQGHTVSGRSLRLDGFGPPVEVCAGAQVLAVEFDAALGDDGLEIGKCRKVGVHDRLVEHGPETLRGLKLGCVARQMEQPDPVWNAKVRFGVPAGLVQHEHEAALAAGRAFLGEGSKERGE